MRGEFAEPVHQDSPRLASLQEMYTPPAREHSLRDYWHILLKRKWMVIVSVAIVLITTALISLHTTPIYEAVTKITISPPTSNPLNFKDNNNSSATLEDPQAGINTQVKILQSDTMAELVIHRMNLDTRADFAGRAQTQSNGGIAVSQSPAEESYRLESLIRKLQGNLTIQEIPDTTLVQIGYSDPNPALAAEIANGIPPRT